ncbi:hypothetical protein GBAR_LOCUS13766 [Geodia barretti]|uniref:Uncharacterized protein n=1 Tax=Geodia barretti TaxID=519541 RepID=A0AA35S528_GEOBA|nr:hypothetical protein GBAR_LOCUS13766 [Geodia barretti]
MADIKGLQQRYGLTDAELGRYLYHSTRLFWLPVPQHGVTTI